LKRTDKKSCCCSWCCATATQYYKVLQASLQTKSFISLLHLSKKLLKYWEAAVAGKIDYLGWKDTEFHRNNCEREYGYNCSQDDYNDDDG
jgi:hypothetical protein